LIAAPICEYCRDTSPGQTGPGDLSTTVRVTRIVLSTRW
jgi:hypothetical protein